MQELGTGLAKEVKKTKKKWENQDMYGKANANT
jgi:hypothetical protein